MTVSEFDTILYHELYDFFYDYEFDLLPNKKQFRRTLSCGFQSVIFSPSAYEGELWLEVNLGIRLNMIEELAQQFLDNHAPYQQDALTLVASIGKLSDNKYFHYKIAEKDDLYYACEEIKRFMEDTGFEFLNTHSSISAMDELLNDRPNKPSKFLYNQSHRCFKGITAAKLVHNPIFLDLVDAYRKFLQKTGTKHSLINQYDKLTNYLFHFSLN
ncbi:MAG: hypothetical protein ACPGJS_10090 [Flammeovirgaceae bacterium]